MNSWIKKFRFVFLRSTIFISDSFFQGDTTISSQYEGFHGYVPPNFRAVDFGSKWQCQWRGFVLGMFFLWVILSFSQTLASLRIEIDNYIVQRQRAEERFAANVSFKHQSFLFLFTDNATNSFKKAPKWSWERFLFCLVFLLKRALTIYASSMLLECTVSQMRLI